LNIAIVVSEFNEEVTSRMLEVAKEKADSMKLTISYVCRVPGAYDMPIIVDKLLQNQKVDGVATLGAIIKGQTKHAYARIRPVAERAIEALVTISKELEKI
jgi:6,7-dimethyl-8-ribityllumazine synthase